MKSGEFNIKGIYGVGIGTELDEKTMYKWIFGWHKLDYHYQ
jgi:hypothetical protein